jgi:hypothetical protein
VIDATRNRWTRARCALSSRGCSRGLVRRGEDLDAAEDALQEDRLREVIGERHRWHAVRGHLHELDGDLPAAATAYAEAARRPRT